MTAPTMPSPFPHGGGPDPSPLRLLPEHLKLLHFAANGHSTPEIADRLIMSRHTVNDYWREIYRQLGARDRANAVAIALVRGLIRPDEVVLRPPRRSDPSPKPHLTPKRGRSGAQESAGRTRTGQ